MIGQYFYIAEYDWGVTVYYNVTKYDVDFCLRQLRKLTTQSKYQNECKQTLYTNKKDRAYVYSSYRRLESVMFIGIPSSTGEFISTITHEANHIKTHIATYYDLDDLVGIKGEVRLDKKKYIERAHKRNISVQFWTINDKEEMRKLIELGADVIMTDSPDVLYELLIEMGYRI